MTVHLVGAGPGDPGLLTVRGREVLEQADVVVYDRLSVAALLELAPPGAERINVGKQRGHHVRSQEDINALLVEHGRAGRRVVRLKGGDPFVFARGGEEALALIEAGIDFEVVPGITSAIAVPAYAGIPVTMRHSSTSFTVVTGHTDPAVERQVDWDAVARVGGTIVVLMGVANIAAIADALMAGGRSPDEPVAAVRWGTRPEQVTVRATLATIADQPLEAPSTIVVGPVAGLDLTWFERRPLLGRRVLVTRAESTGEGRLAGILRSAGADAVEVPLLEFEDPSDGGAALREAFADVGRWDWLVLTSARTVERISSVVHDARDLAGPRLAVIGSATARALRSLGVEADLVPERFVAEGLLDVFPPPHDGGRVLLARAEVGRDVLPEGLQRAGWAVDLVAAYRTVARRPDADERAVMDDVDVVTFTSASAVSAYLDARAGEGPPDGVTVAVIGPVVAAACEAAGITVDVVGDPHTLDGLVAALSSST